MSFSSFSISPGGTLQGSMQVPGDKSISHRSIIFGAIAQGTTTVSHFLQGEDCLATLRAFKNMGVSIEGPIDNQVIIHGVGLKGLHSPGDAIDCGNSGTSIRLLSGLLAGQQFDSTLTGDESLLKRPMTRVTDPLQQMGAVIETHDGKAPLHIKGAQSLQAIDYVMPVASAQVKSCLLLAGLYAKGKTKIIEPAVTRDHT